MLDAIMSVFYSLCIKHDVSCIYSDIMSCTHKMICNKLVYNHWITIIISVHKMTFVIIFNRQLCCIDYYDTTYETNELKVIIDNDFLLFIKHFHNSNTSEWVIGYFVVLMKLMNVSYLKPYIMDSCSLISPFLQRII